MVVRELDRIPCKRPAKSGIILKSQEAKSEESGICSKLVVSFSSCRCLKNVLTYLRTNLFNVFRGVSSLWRLEQSSSSTSSLPSMKRR
ncbi:hypothetical protein TNCV_3670821 [Trichonephila clavipes]|nr:hypothetical protein TNCV_3670821 [Trichonephila clavipes]